MTDPTPWIQAVRRSHDRFAALVGTLTPEQVTAPSYDDDWSIADVASHLGSQAEIFGLFVEAGLTGTDAPGPEAFGPVWDRWNATPPAEQVTASVAVNEAFVARIEQLSDADRDSFAMSFFGSDLDLAGMLGLRLGEHALHVWDVAVALDPTAVVAPDAVALLVDTVGVTAGRAGKPVEGADPVVIETVSPTRSLVVTLDPAVTLAPSTGESTGGVVRLPAEALVRLVAGRLDPDHTPNDVVDDGSLAVLRTAFPGF